jgi:hypothetical protein
MQIRAASDIRFINQLKIRSVILSSTGVPAKRRSCDCWGVGAKDLLFARAKSKADPSVAQIGATSG